MENKIEELTIIEKVLVICMLIGASFAFWVFTKQVAQSFIDIYKDFKYRNYNKETTNLYHNQTGETTYTYGDLESIDIDDLQDQTIRRIECEVYGGELRDHAELVTVNGSIKLPTSEYCRAEDGTDFDNWQSNRGWYQETTETEITTLQGLRR